jgi:LacI family transcriptional regulator
MARCLRIAVLMESHRKSLRAVLRGIAAYGRDHGPWSLYHLEGPLEPALVDNLHGWRGDGVIFRSDHGELIRKVARLGLPWLNLRHVFDSDDVIQMGRHHQAVARLAAEHLLQRGFEHFAYCGFQGQPFSDRRGEAFVHCLAAKAPQPALFTGLRWEFRGSVSDDNRRREDSLAQWLGDLPKPVGLMTCSDLCGQKVLRACSELGIAVPEQVAVVSVDNDDLLCELCDPPLSSVDPDFEKMGYESAAALDRIIRNEPPPAHGTAVEPLGVVLRASSDVQAIADPEVAAAIHYIRQHACEGILVEDVFRAVRLSRSTLERRFAKLVGRSPRAEIMRRQIERVQRLLVQTDFPLKKIAQISGFNYPESMCHLFKRIVGQSPMAYRKRNAKLPSGS